MHTPPSAPFQNLALSRPIQIENRNVRIKIIEIHVKIAIFFTKGIRYLQSAFRPFVNSARDQEEQQLSKSNPCLASSNEVKFMFSDHSFSFENETTV